MSAAKPIHGARKPVNVPSDMRDESPVPCAVKAGDKVIYTNDQGVQFERTVRGFAVPARRYGSVYLDNQAWWMPVRAESLTPRASGAAS